MTESLDELKLRGAALGITGEHLHAILGCEWGRTIGLRCDIEPCFEQADGIVILYEEGEPVQQVKLCQPHLDRVNKETDPHAL